MRQQEPERVRGSPKVTQQVSKTEGGDPRQALSSAATRLAVPRWQWRFLQGLQLTGIWVSDLKLA